MDFDGLNLRGDVPVLVIKTRVHCTENTGEGKADPILRGGGEDGWIRAGTVR